MTVFTQLTRSCWLFISRLIVPDRALHFDNLDIAYGDMETVLAVSVDQQRARAALTATRLMEQKPPTDNKFDVSGVSK